jgi:hypothetical protein
MQDNISVHRTRHHHSYGNIIAIAVGRCGCANRFAGSGPGNARPLGTASSLYPASSLPYIALCCPRHLRQPAHMPTSLLPWPSLLVWALPNMKTMPVAFVLPPSSCTWHRLHIQCCQRPSLCCAARCNQGDRCTFIVNSGHPLSAMAVACGILVTRCACPQGTDAVVVLAALN